MRDGPEPSLKPSDDRWDLKNVGLRLGFEIIYTYGNWWFFVPVNSLQNTQQDYTRLLW